LNAPKTGTALAIISAEIDVIADRAKRAADKAEKYALHHKRRSEHADRIADWASHRKEAMRAALFMVADLVQAATPFTDSDSAEAREPHQTVQILVRYADIIRLRDALARIGEVP
jgi:hypothetical protein